jgi:hypothetical protein
MSLHCCGCGEYGCEKVVEYLRVLVTEVCVIMHCHESHHLLLVGAAALEQLEHHVLRQQLVLLGTDEEGRAQNSPYFILALKLYHKHSFIFTLSNGVSGCGFTLLL